MTTYRLDLLTCELDALREMTPDVAVEELATTGLHLLDSDAGGDGRLPAATTSGEDLDELVAVIARRAARIASLRHRRAAARRVDAATEPTRRYAREENARVDARMTELETERDRLLVEISTLEGRLTAAGLDFTAIAPSLGRWPGVPSTAASVSANNRAVFARWAREDQPHHRSWLLRRMFRRTGGEAPS